MGLQLIKSFKDRATERRYAGEHVKAFSAIRKAALRKLDMLDAAKSLNDLQSPPGNKLESLVGNRSGQHSVRVNAQFRICFVWNEGALEVEIVDYH